MRMRRVGGFTLVELMVALSIAVILLAVAVPSFRTLILNGRRATLANELILALTYAKSEAFKRGAAITVCSRKTDTTCKENDLDKSDWDRGWLIFVDDNKDGALDPSELVVQVYPALPSGSTLRTGDRGRVTFRGTGFSAGSTVTFRLCDSRGKAQARGIVLSNQGRVRTETGTAECP